MSVTTEKESVVEKAAGAPQATGGSTMQITLIGILVLVVALLIAYQFIGCAGCYGGG